MEAHGSSEIIRDPVHRSRYSFRRDGENMTVETWIEPGGGLPPHLHPRQEERWSVLDGKIQLRLGKERRVIGPEDGEVLVRPGTVHGFRSVSDSDTHMSCYVTPALGLEEFLTDSAAAAQQGLILRGDIPRGIRGARWAATFLKRHQDDVVMTWPPAILQRALIALLAR
jgi:quercetin dioxygenase-like cupin family protein